MYTLSLRFRVAAILALIVNALVIFPGRAEAQSGGDTVCRDGCTPQQQQCEADSRSIFGRCAELLGGEVLQRQEVDPELCEHLELLFRDMCLNHVEGTGTCLDRCDDGSTEECEVRCLEEIYATWKRRAARRERIVAVLDARDRDADLRENPDLSIAAKAAIRRQIQDDFSEFRLTYERDQPVIEPPCGRVDPQPITLIRVTAQGLLREATTDCSGGNICAFPNDYDVGGSGPTLIYRLDTFSAATILRYRNGEDGKSMHVFVNDVEIPLGTLAFVNLVGCDPSSGIPANSDLADCMAVTINEAAWYPPSAPWPTWHVRVELQDDDPRSEEFQCVHHIQPAEKLKSFWLYTIGESVASARCTTCHGMDTEQLILLRHNGLDVEVERIPSALHPATQFINGGNCGNCHFLPSQYFAESRWATPTAEQNIDWGKIIVANFVNWPYAVCETMVTNLPTPELRAKHFHEDARLFWAVAKLSCQYPTSIQFSNFQPTSFKLATFKKPNFS